MQKGSLEPGAEQENNLFLTFQVGRDSYALAIGYVHEIVRFQPIIPIPQQKAYLKGVMNLRDQIFPVIDLAMRLGRAETRPTERTCIVLMESGGEQVGLIVDAVSEVVDIPSEKIESFAGASAGEQDCVCGIAKIDGGIRMVLDCGAVMGQPPYVPHPPSPSLLNT